MKLNKMDESPDKSNPLILLGLTIYMIMANVKQASHPTTTSIRCCHKLIVSYTGDHCRKYKCDSDHLHAGNTLEMNAHTLKGNT